MNGPLRRVGIVLMVMFGLLFVNLNWVQVYKADDYRTSVYNAGRVQVDEYKRERGPILVGRDGTVAATNVETDGRLRYLRTYPEDELWAHVLGYRPVELAATGIERYESEFLAGSGDRFFVDRMRDLFTGSQTIGGTVRTTLSRAAQEAAFAQLQENQTGTDRGAVVALDPRTGAVQALVSMPSFDPNPLASHDLPAAAVAHEELTGAAGEPLRNRALAERFEPGSVFKVIDAAAALQHDFAPDTRIPGGASYLPPTAGDPIENAPGVSCGDELTLARALAISCNTAFARLAAEELGGGALRETAAAFGFGDEELRVGRLDEGGDRVADSVTGDMLRPDGQEDPPTVAQSAIGQASVQITPMMGAMIAATVANNGVQMRPYVVEQLLDAQLRQVYRASPERLRTPIPSEVAEPLRDMMVGVVEGGTGTAAQLGGVLVGGKTGTAETGGDDDPDHGWFVGFAIVDGEPVSAVAVLLQNAGRNGSSEAARIAGQVMRAVVGEQGGG